MAQTRGTLEHLKQKAVGRGFVNSPFFRIQVVFWETDFYTPQVLGGAALLLFSAPAVYKNPVP